MRNLILLLVGTCTVNLVAQDGDIAYAGGTKRTVEHTTRVEKLSMVEGAVPGSMELVLPTGTTQVDVLNGNGRVKHRFNGSEIESFNVSDLRPGTWTLRAHTGQGMVVRRFMVMYGGHIWTLDQLPGKAQRKTRAPLD